jgi:dienelactone hydrolase
VYGEADARINSQLPVVVEQMKRFGKSFEADSYPGTGHGFLKPGRRGNDTDQPGKAWKKILDFFGDNLK